MTVNELISGVLNCECGKVHLCPIKEVIIGEGAITSIPSVCAKYSKILLVADENTYGAAGKSVADILGDKIYDSIIFSGAEILVPDEKAIDAINKKITEETDLVLGVGSGVINDLCKHTSFLAKLPYHIVATAPSMDGYASRGAALILGGMKVTLNANVPEAIIADTDVLKNAPMPMILAGYGDIIGKYSCLTDWKLSSIVNGEYICQFVLSATYDEIKKTRSLAKKLRSRDSDAIAALIRALVAVGILMAYVGNSRPASGSEHHFSHYFEIVGIVKGEEYLSHGIDVFYSTAETSKIRELILNTDINAVTLKPHDRKNYEKRIKEIYGSVSDEVITLQDKLGWYEDREKRVKKYRESWEEICAVLKSAPTFSEVCDMIREVGLSYDEFVNLYGRRKIDDAYLYAKDLKDRYTVLWMYSDIFG